MSGLAFFKYDHLVTVSKRVFVLEGKKKGWKKEASCLELSDW